MRGPCAFCPRERTCRGGDSLPYSSRRPRQAREATYTNVEDTEAELRPEGVQYDRLTVMLIDVVQRQQKAIDALEAKVAALEAQ